MSQRTPGAARSTGTKAGTPGRTSARRAARPAAAPTYAQRPDEVGLTGDIELSAEHLVLVRQVAGAAYARRILYDRRSDRYVGLVVDAFGELACDPLVRTPWPDPKAAERRLLRELDDEYHRARMGELGAASFDEATDPR